MKVRPSDIKPDFMIRGTPFEYRYMFVRSDMALADRFYRYMGQCASADVQQLIIDCFLTSLPRMELDLYELIRRSILFGAGVAEDYKDETLHRIQMAIRDLYREAHSLIRGVDFVDENGVSVASLNPRNCVLPIIKNHILNDPEHDDILAYDRRHSLLLMRNGCEDDIIDTRRLPVLAVSDPRQIYEAFWPYVIRQKGTLGGNLFGIGTRRADSFDPLWRIA